MTHPGGRPRKFETVAQMEEAIEAYFAKCDARTTVVVSKHGPVEVPRPEPYTVTGLGMAIGLTRQGLLEYQERNEFSDTIKRAKERVHADLERRAYDGEGSTAGVIFGLKNNYNWRDVQDHNVKSSVSVHFDAQDEKLL